MKELFRKFSVAYFAGALGGLAHALVAWLCGTWGLYTWLHVQMSTPAFTWGYLSWRIWEGSLWALLIVFLAPLLRVRGIMLGLVLSLLPSAYILLVHYPAQHLGWLGSARGQYAFVFILLFYAAWGMVTGALYNSEYKP